METSQGCVGVTLDVLLPTYNRASLLSRTLESLWKARVPTGLHVKILVIDNNSSDNTQDVVADYRRRLPNLEYVIERQQGLSAALNAGIRAGTGELIATINDDEEVDIHWFDVIHRFFANPEFSFAGGPYHPNWSRPKPDWVTKEFGSVVGWVEAGDAPRQYGPGFNAMLMGGNAVFRRSAFERVGLYNTSLGRSAKGLASCEDEDLFGRLLAADLKGMYLPDLIIHHYIPAERMTRAYHRRWCWGRGTSHGLLSRNKAPDVAAVDVTSPAVINWFGVPRWQIRRAVVGAFTALKARLGFASPAAGLAGELYVLDLAGFIYGRFLQGRFVSGRRSPAFGREPQTSHP
jgi:glycosyltransferase involved in cell wall biosynthesis